VQSQERVATLEGKFQSSRQEVGVLNSCLDALQRRQANLEEDCRRYELQTQNVEQTLNAELKVAYKQTQDLEDEVCNA